VLDRVNLLRFALLQEPSPLLRELKEALNVYVDRANGGVEVTLDNLIAQIG